MGVSLLKQLVQRHGPEAAFRAFNGKQRKALKYCWPAHARPEQLAPEGDWTTWLILAGRGFGKTRAGVEYVIQKAKAMPGSRGFLAGRSAGDVRDVLVEGESGILAKSPPWFMPRYEPSKRRLTWPNGSMATTYSADAPGAGRGPQHHWGQADELAAWGAWELWDNLQMGLRLGDRPQACVTTTPRPLRIIRELLKDSTTALTRGSTYDNADNLPRTFINKILRKYQGTRLGRQELEAEVLDDVPGSLWTRLMLEALQVPAPVELQRIVVAIDPATTSGDDSDMTGIIVAGLGIDDVAYVLEDLTCRLSPSGWANRAVDAFDRWKADLIVGETNQGGDMVETTIRASVKGRSVPFKGVHAKKGKRTRAEPVSALYEQKRVRHVGMVRTDGGLWRPRNPDERGLDDLEDQMVQFTVDGLVGGDEEKATSPDRVDACVYALTELVLEHEEGWLVSSAG